jgi:cell division protein FtsL
MTPPAAAAAAAPAVHPRRTVSPGRTRPTPARPRRVSGPARPARPAAPLRPGTGARHAERASWPGSGIALGLLRLPHGLERSRLLDRLLRGRISIALVTFALIGIVTLQLGVLKLNSTIGHTLEREALLQRENSALSIENSEMAAGDRVEARAVQLGMQLVPVSALRFLSVRPGLDAGRGAAALRTPVASASSGSAEATAGAATSTAGSSSSSSSAESTTSEGSASSSTGESSGAPAGETQQASGVAAQPSPSEPASSAASAPAPASESSSNGSPAPTAPAESSPAGGTQAGPTG